jgi:hypothetical protein
VKTSNTAGAPRRDSDPVASSTPPSSQNLHEPKYCSTKTKEQKRADNFMKYETYRRIRITSPALVMLYYGCIGLIVTLLFPYLVATGHDHLAAEEPHAVRFISTVPLPDSDDTHSLRVQSVQYCVFFRWYRDVCLLLQVLARRGVCHLFGTD